ncbi:alpha/beta-hydrolase [Lentinus tigrinus ALCF2SS1-7]|uniref:alpha/beta-hydrolase n=1 Tax=Lentinus tigrinus ALCF2SS1-7 TaxID=1328758 RepID=UPI00116638B8|nr:alpha/beta-hydrolase [Lentinus tigrinus ALCF2SS1-7]
MDTLDRKLQEIYVPRSYEPTQDEAQPPRKRLSRRAKFWVITLAAVGTVCLHLGGETTQLPHVSSPVSAVAEFDWYALEPSTDINWTPCYDGHLCARLLLPLDYLSEDPDGPTTAIALRMIPAASRGTADYRGTVLINPGGPGGSGTNLVERAGANISRIVGGSFDVLGFDPRGTGASTPRVECFASAAERNIWMTQVGHQFLNASDHTLGLYRAREQVVAAKCEQAIGGELGIARFMSTASVATDMIKITEKLGQEKLHYWGFSYGSILGQYFSAMYPEKVGRVIIDGVYDGDNYRGALWSSNLADMEAVMDSLFTYCHEAGPLRCTLYESTPDTIRARYFGVLDEVARNPIAIPLAEPPVILTRKALITQLFSSSYKPLANYGTIVDTIRAIETGNQTALTALAPKIVDPTECKCSSGTIPWLAENDAFNAIACGDGEEHPYDPEYYANYYDELVKDSPHGGPIWAVHYLQCAEWRVRPKWRYTGPLAAANTSHPLLLISPRYDPVCPLRDALAVRERYSGAGLLVQNSHGHCSLSAPSLCTAKHVRAYMEHGVLPKEGAVCEADELPLIGSVSDVSAMSLEDQELLEAIRGLSEVVPMFGF